MQSEPGRRAFNQPISAISCQFLPSCVLISCHKDYALFDVRHAAILLVTTGIFLSCDNSTTRKKRWRICVCQMTDVVGVFVAVVGCGRRRLLREMDM